MWPFKDDTDAVQGHGMIEHLPVDFRHLPDNATLIVGVPGRLPQSCTIGDLREYVMNTAQVAARNEVMKLSKRVDRLGGDVAECEHDIDELRGKQ